MNNPAYPGIVADFTRSFALLKSLPCDVFLGAHGSYYGLQGKIARMQQHASGNPFIDPQGYRTYLDQAQQAFEQELEEQRRKASTVSVPEQP